MPVIASYKPNSSSLRARAAFFAVLLAAIYNILASNARAAGSPGTSAANFLQLGYGARPIGMGEAFTPVANDVSAVHYNPAGLVYPAVLDAKAKGPYEIMASQGLLYQGVTMTQLGVVKRPFGLSLTHMSLGGIEQRTSETIEPEATVGASGLTFGVSYALKVGDVGVGVTGKVVRETIANYSASAYAVDLGALHRFESRPISLGFSLTNLGTKIRYIDESYSLPTIARFGAAYGLTKDFPHAIALQIDAPRDASVSARLGFEYRGFGPISLRGGYRTQSSRQRTAAVGSALGSTANGLADFYGMSLGAGLRTQYGDLDYALVPYGELGMAHRLSYSFNFGSTGGKR